MRRFLVGCAVALAVLATAPPALAITREEATRIALETLKPDARRAPTVVFALPAPLGPRQRLAEAGAARAGQKAPKPRAIGRRVWLFWEDQAPYARFQHPSRLLLVDDAAGRVVLLRKLRWWPEVDGKRPPFLATRSAYDSRRFRVYSSVRRTAARAAPRAPARTRPLAVPADAFKDDCLITIGLKRDPQFAQDFVGMHAFAREVGLRSFEVNPARRGGRTYGGDLQRGVRYLVESQRCKDVFIYMSGHGYENGEPAVQSDAKEADGTQPVVTAATLRRILVAHPTITFKIKIDACYSGRFVPELKHRRNLLVLETSSAADEVSWSYLGSSYPTRDFEPQTRTTPNPSRGEFTNANLAGMRSFLASATEVSQAQAAGGSLLAHMIARSYELGAKVDLARTGEWTHPQLHTNLPRAPAPAAMQLDFSLAYNHTAPGRSYVCAAIEATSGSLLTLELRGEDGSTLRGTLQLKDKETKTAPGSFSFGISSYGRYTVSITATKNGRSITKSQAITVTERAGSSACGP